MGLSSIPGVGTTFLFDAELAVGASPPIGSTELLTRNSNSKTFLEKSTLQGLRLLLVDDRPVRAAQLSSQLAALGIFLDVVHTVEEAVSLMPPNGRYSFSESLDGSPVSSGSHEPLLFWAKSGSGGDFGGLDSPSERSGDQRKQGSWGRFGGRGYRKQRRGGQNRGGPYGLILIEAERAQRDVGIKEACKKLLEAQSDVEASDKVPLVLIWGYSEAPEEIYKCGYSGVILKPLRKGSLAAGLEMVLKGEARGKSGEGANGVHGGEVKASGGEGGGSIGRRRGAELTKGTNGYVEKSHTTLLKGILNGLKFCVVDDNMGKSTSASVFLK